MPVITISRQFGSYGDKVAELICERLGTRILDKHLVRVLAAQAGVKPEQVINLAEDRYHPRTLLDRFFAYTPPRTRDLGLWAEYGTELVQDDLDKALLTQLIQAAYERGQMVILGRGGQVVLREKPDVLHVRLVAPLALRIRRHQIRAGLSTEEARAQVLESDQASADFIRRYYGVDVADPALYDLILNTGRLSLVAVVNLIIGALAALPAGA